MFPLRDSIASESTPYVTISLIVINVIVFIFQFTLSENQLHNLINLFGVVPADFTGISIFQILLGGLFPFISLFTAMFLHGGIIHLFGNMIYLWVFGDNIEDRIGHLGFLVFYLTAGVAGSFFHILTNPTSTVPTIGASGAVAGVLGAYFLLYPKAKVQALVFLGFIFTVTRIRAVYFLFLWFVLQFINVLSSTQGTQPVAWWAHIGGFAVGAMIAFRYMQQVRVR
ncbi:membrane associated rhomboid family serine protease [Desulfitispora alkaliphila]|uniref:rhomboid family intramembrane serine protease n=1 Tax=Desulfitispora alkaliphila TaxID=622674 RepID=UPI003D1C5BF9